MSASDGFIDVKAEGHNEKVLALLQAHENVSHVNREGDLFIAVLNKPTTAEQMNAYFFEEGITLSHLVKRKPSLEQQFLTITNNN